MAWTLPRTLRRLGAELVHTQYAMPLLGPCPAVVTIHDLSFERGLMGRRDRLVFRHVVPRAARTAARVVTVSERTKADLVEHYGLAPERVSCAVGAQHERRMPCVRHRRPPWHRPGRR